MLEQAFVISGIVTVALAGLVASNYLYDRGVAASLSRRVPGVLGGAAFLAAVLWLDAWDGRHAIRRPDTAHPGRSIGFSAPTTGGKGDLLDAGVGCG